MGFISMGAKRDSLNINIAHRQMKEQHRGMAWTGSLPAAQPLLTSLTAAPDGLKLLLPTAGKKTRKRNFYL